MPLSRTFTEAFGWYGVATILLAYAGNMFGLLDVHHPLYLFLNITGSLGIAIDAWKQKNWQPVVLNIIWMAVAIVGIVSGMK